SALASWSVDDSADFSALDHRSGSASDTFKPCLVVARHDDCACRRAFLCRVRQCTVATALVLDVTDTIGSRPLFSVRREQHREHGHSDRLSVCLRTLCWAGAADTTMECRLHHPRRVGRLVCVLCEPLRGRTSIAPREGTSER